ncbi:MAG: MarR family transcriptional regulator [Micromonosporaceae bacterium]|nr:MarR family transcriptional regulator [Micromonosporaceae bacterium]
MTEWLTDAQLRGWRAYIEGSLRLNARLEDDLRAATGLTMADYNVLVVLSEAPRRRLRMGELAERLVFSPSRLTYQISSMERRGLVRRESCPADRRGSEAVLTDEGMAKLRASAPHHVASVRQRLIDLLDGSELAALTAVFERVKSALDGPPGATRSAAGPSGVPVAEATV